MVLTQRQYAALVCVSHRIQIFTMRTLLIFILIAFYGDLSAQPKRTRHFVHAGVNYSAFRFPNGQSINENSFFGKDFSSKVGYTFGYRIDKMLGTRLSYGVGLNYTSASGKEYYYPSTKDLAWLLGFVPDESDGKILLTNSLNFGFISLPVFAKMKLPRGFYVQGNIGLSCMALGKMETKAFAIKEDGTQTNFISASRGIKRSRYGFRNGLPLAVFGQMAVGKEFYIGSRTCAIEVSYLHDISTWRRPTFFDIYFNTAFQSRIVSVDFAVGINQWTRRPIIG